MNKLSDNYQILQKFILAVFIFMFIIIISFLVRWQFIDQDTFKNIAAQRYKEKSISSIRGDILAKDGTTLAYSEIRYDVFAYLVDIQDAEAKSSVRPPLQSRSEFVRKVSTLLNTSEEDIKSKLELGPVWMKLAEQVDLETKNLLENISTDANKERTLVGLNFEFNPRRVYPEKELGAHILGFLGKDLNSNDMGRYGLEQKYNGTLESQDGFVAGETDKFGNIIAISDSISIRAKRGSTITTTLDPALQKIAQSQIKLGVERYEAESGSIVIIDPKTGEILALGNYPEFNPQEYYNEQTSDVFTNKAISIPYEVGSIAKVFTMASAVEELGIKSDEIIIDGHEGCRDIVASNKDDVREICTFDKQPKGPLTASEALTKSDNLAFVALTEKIGKEAFYNSLTGFGVGKLTEVDLTGESIGFLPDIDDPKAWHPVDLAVFSFGHGYQMNLLQATRGIAALANDGWVMQPFMVSEISDSDGNRKIFDPININKVVSKDTSEQVSLMMEDVFRAHTSTDYRQLKQYPVAGKSGTALIPYKDKAGYSDEINATYVGFDTSDSHHFIMAIKLEAPQAVDKLSFYSARPLWMETYEIIKDHFNIRPNQ